MCKINIAAYDRKIMPYGTSASGAIGTKYLALMIAKNNSGVVWACSFRLTKCSYEA